MTYFSLRKQQPEPGPEHVEEDIDEAEAEPEDDEEPISSKQLASPKPPPGCLGVFILGARGLAAWLAACFGPGPALAAHLAAGWAVFHYKGWIPAAVVGGWVVLVGAFIPKTAAEQLAARIEQRDKARHAPPAAVEAPEPEAESEETQPSAADAAVVLAVPDPQDVADLVRDLIGDDTGILLTALRGPLRVTETRAVRRVLDEAGIRVRPGVRTEAGNGPGVHRADVAAAALPPDDSPGREVVAGERANNNANAVLRVQSREGMTIISDPADSHRTHRLKKP